MRVAFAVCSCVLVLACSGAARHVEPPLPPPPAPEPEPEPAPEPAEVVPVIPEDTASPDGPGCMRTSECGPGLACRGAPGCTTSWACGAPRETCGPEIVSYCDCDGITFHAPSGCAGRSYAHVGPCDDPGIADSSYGLPDGDEPITERDRTCTSSSECRGGEICYGPPGCGMAWRCERARGCARRGRASFCSCAGETFTGQTHCPGQPYAHRGACDEAVASTSTSPSTSISTSTSSATATTTTATTAATTTAATTATTTASAHPTATARAPLAPGTCRTNRDCARGEVCAGPSGCGDPWTCIHRADRCNPDTQYFCDCEGETFTASMTCPTRPYVHRGSCAIDQALDLAGAALR